MREKDLEAKEKILESAKVEFMEKGFMDASMRVIAERAGFTTGMTYSRFADKNEIFNAIVQKGASELYKYFIETQNEFLSFDEEKQKKEMHGYTDVKMLKMIDIIYDNYDCFKLIITKSAGSEYEHFVDKLIDIETESTGKFIANMRKIGIEVSNIEKDLKHMLASALFNGIFEIVSHDYKKEDAFEYVKQLQRFFNAGWDCLLKIR